MNRRTASLWTALVVASVSLVGIAAPEATAFKTLAAKNAAAAYAGAVDRAKTEHDAKVAVARKVYLDQLALAKEAATKAGNLDEAVLIRDSMIKIKSEAAVAPAQQGVVMDRQKLAARLAGTEWKTGGKIYKFNADGTGLIGEVTDPFLWTPADDHRVFVLHKGGFTARLDFDSELKSFAFQEFGNGTRRDQQAGSPAPQK